MQHGRCGLESGGALLVVVEATAMVVWHRSTVLG